MKAENIIEQARKRLKPRQDKTNIFYKMWLEAHREPSWVYRQYVLCEPIDLQPEDQAYLDSIKQETSE